MANITRIKAGDSNKKKPAEQPKNRPAEAHSAKEVVAKQPKPTNTKAPHNPKKKPMPTWLKVITWPFRMIAKPFIALGRYLRDSWLEIRQVRWPSRGATWKMVLAVLIYAAIFMVFIMLLDALFTFIFNNLLG